MENYTQVKQSLHFIDRETKKTIKKDLAEIDAQTEKDLEKIITKIFFHKNCREYNFQKSSYVNEKILSILENQELWEDQTTNIADKLLDKETRKQKKITERFSHVTKGSLLQILLTSKNDETEYYFVLAKINHHAYLSETDLKRDIGIPEKVQVFKSAVIKIMQNKIVNIKLFDSSKPISEYWWSDFLELEPKIDNEENTKKVFYNISSAIKYHTTRDKKEDRRSLLNRFYVYMESCGSFNFEELMNALFNNYKKHNDKCNIEHLKKRIKESKNDYDKIFNVDTVAFRKQLDKKNYTINNLITATIPESLAMNPNMIYANQKNDGTKFIHIKLENDDLYNKYKDQ